MQALCSGLALMIPSRLAISIEMGMQTSDLAHQATEVLDHYRLFRPRGMRSMLCPCAKFPTSVSKLREGTPCGCVSNKV